MNSLIGIVNESKLIEVKQYTGWFCKRGYVNSSKQFIDCYCKWEYVDLKDTN